jgi:hypothetical protein
MSKLNIDFKKIAELTLNISRINKEIKDLFPDGNGEILKHLASSSIHLTIFMKNVYEISNDIKLIHGNEEEFLKSCGCNFDLL